MTRWALRIGRFAFLVVITLVASGVMWWVSRKGDDGGGIGSGVAVSPPPTAAAPSSLVYVTPVKPEWRDVTIRYSGKIRPWETYTLGFETAGRVAELGRSSAGRPLDDGDRVDGGRGRREGAHRGGEDGASEPGQGHGAEFRSLRRPRARDLARGV